MVLVRNFPYYIPPKGNRKLKLFCLPEEENANEILEIFFSRPNLLHHQAEQNNTSFMYEKIFIANFSESKLAIKLSHPFYGVEKDQPFILQSGENATFTFIEEINFWLITK